MLERGHLLLDTLEQLLSVSSSDLTVALADASDLVARALKADKVDVFIYEASRDSLVALGSSHQTLSELQKRHGLDVLPLANGGRTVDIFQRAETFMSGQTERDPEELRGIKETLGVRSSLGVPLYVGRQLRGVLMAVSQEADYWEPHDVAFIESVARWIGIVVHRAELSAEAARSAVEQSRRAAADELVTIVAHDVRNYLAPLDLRLRVLSRRAEREGREADLRDLNITLKGVARLGNLIGDLLDAARLDQGVLCMDAQALDLLALLEETAVALETSDHPIEVQAADEIWVLADGARVRQTLENLLSNAISHSPKGGKVRAVLARVRNDEGEWASVEIIDEGPGIAEHVLPHIFERYVKGSRSGGLGLGLYLAKQIVEMHGGELSVESKPGTGARFRLTLPCCSDSK